MFLSFLYAEKLAYEETGKKLSAKSSSPDSTITESIVFLYLDSDSLSPHGYYFL